MFPQAKHYSPDFDTNMTQFALASADVAAKVALYPNLKSVLGAWSAVPHWSAQMIKVIREAKRRLPDVLAIAPYFYGTDTASIDACITQLKEALDIANGAGVELALYEMGQHLVPGNEQNRGEEMGEAYQYYLSAMAQAAKKPLLANHFTYVSKYDGSGSWGLRESQYSPATDKAMVVEGFKLAKL
jgi:hypothetical protein